MAITTVGQAVALLKSTGLASDATIGLQRSEVIGNLPDGTPVTKPIHNLPMSFGQRGMQALAALDKLPPTTAIP